MTNSSKRFHSPFDGYIGISPGYDASSGMIENSKFMQEMMEAEMIDYPIVSIYSNSNFGYSSIVKFGGWGSLPIGN